MYPTLQSMGVTSIQDIEKFTLRYEAGHDVLKIYYRREKTYRQVQEPSLVVLRAMEELEQIVGKQHESKASKEDLIKELEHLEKVVNSKINEIKEKIDAMS